MSTHGSTLMNRTGYICTSITQFFTIIFTLNTAAW